MYGKRLYKSTDDELVSGVLGGLAEYWDADPTMIRFIFVILALAGFGGVLLILYAIASFIIPEPPKKVKKRRNK